MQQPNRLKSLGDRIKSCRQALGLTQEELARRADISKGFLSEVENNSRNLSADNLMKLARELKVSLDYLMKGEFGTTNQGKQNSKYQAPS
jgi:transcriptional regulator with XRE-family HTH domain